MEMSSRARRMERAYKLRKQPALNLISLMDIFTILVFFLLVTSSSSQQLPNSKDLKLPNSVAKKAPKETLIIMVTDEHILVQGLKVVLVKDILEDNKDTITKLYDELIFQGSKKRLTKTQENKTVGYSATIMGDENLPFELLDRILQTCRLANYTQIAFAANQKSKN